MLKRFLIIFFLSFIFLLIPRTVHADTFDSNIQITQATYDSHHHFTIAGTTTLDDGLAGACIIQGTSSPHTLYNGPCTISGGTFSLTSSYTDDAIGSIPWTLRFEEHQCSDRGDGCGNYYGVTGVDFVHQPMSAAPDPIEQGQRLFVDCSDSSYTFSIYDPSDNATSALNIPCSSRLYNVPADAAIGTYNIVECTSNTCGQSTLSDALDTDYVNDNIQFNVIAATDNPPPPPNDNPTISQLPDIAVNAGWRFSKIGTFSDPDYSESWTGTVDYGDGSGAGPLKIYGGNKFYLNHVYDTAGDYTIAVTINDDLGGQSTSTINAHIYSLFPNTMHIDKPRQNDGNQWYLSNFSPTLESLGDTSCYNSAGATDPYTGIAHAIGTGIYDTTSNTHIITSSASCTLYSDHGVTVSIGITPQQYNQLPYGTYHYFGVGNNTHAIWVSDDFTISPVDNEPVITSLPNPDSIIANQNFSDTGTFTDPDSSSWTGNINYGDGTGLQTLNITGNGTFEVSHTYSQPGTYTYVVNVKDDLGVVGNKIQTVVVNGPTPTPTPTPSQVTLSPIADTYIKNGSQNENEGNSTFLELQSSGHRRNLVKFDQSSIQAAIGNSQNYTATLRFTITDNGNNWGTTGRTIEAHRLTQDWTEGNGFIDGNSPTYRGTGSGATWNCATDSNIANQNDDCSGSIAWNMDNSSSWPFVTNATSTKTIQNNQTGTVDFDVTADVQSFVNGSSQDFGWLIKKTDEGQNGRIDFGSRQTSSSPILILNFN
ncbi:MAG TPA: DNRLRE domain-containing protein [Patescibacteria group bacterium]|nr:DNRLRE domain-containing protein [Patescibacteria group bacterium]